MFFSRRISLKQLAAFCQRASISLLAGIDERTILAREAQNATGRAARGHFATVSQMVNGGKTLSAGLAAGGDFFPPLFREMVAMGEQSGRLGEVLKQLAGHYQHQIAVRRSFLAAITWPAFQLAVAIAVIGFLIWIMGVINGGNPKPIDPLGFGLIGNDGLVKYAAFIGSIGIVLAVTVRAVRRGVFWTRPLQRVVLRIPVVGPALQTAAVARLAWVMSQTMSTSMEVRRSLRLAFESTRNARYVDHIGQVEAEIAAGHSVYDAFSVASVFPADFLETVHVGERSGTLAESMAQVAEQCQEQARASLNVMATVGGFAVWAVVAAIIVWLIFRLAMFYLGVLNAAGLP